MSDFPDDGAAVQHIIDNAQEAVKPTLIEQSGETGLAAYVVPQGAKVQVVDLTDLLAKHQPRPASKTSHRVAHDPVAFINYVKRHALTDGTEVYADILSTRITALIDGDGAQQADAGWQRHSVVYNAQLTDAWKAWMPNDGKWLDQQPFAELLEDRAVDIVEPDSATMLEVSQSFKATMGVAFKSAKNLSSGETELTYKEDVEASAGRTAQLSIPTEFIVGLQPFEGARTYKVTARFRYRINGGQLKMSYRLTRPNDILREAFNDVADIIRDGVPDNVAVYAGSPA